MDQPTIAELCAPISARPRPGERRTAATRHAIRQRRIQNGGYQDNHHVDFSDTLAMERFRQGLTIPQIARELKTYPEQVYRFLERKRKAGELE